MTDGGRVFGWEIRRRGADELAFTDTVGGVSGVFTDDRSPDRDPACGCT